MLPNNSRGFLEVDYVANRGLTIVGLKNNDYAVLIAYLSSFYGTVQALDSHLGMALGGYIADVARISSFMLSYNSRIRVPVYVATPPHEPFKVGMLFARYVEQGPRIYHVMPFGDVIDCQAMAIGANAHRASAYFEQIKGSLLSCSMDQLICHGIKGIREAMGNNTYSTRTICGGVVGVDMPFKVFNTHEMRNYKNMADAMGPL